MRNKNHDLTYRQIGILITYPLIDFYLVQSPGIQASRQYRKLEKRILIKTYHAYRPYHRHNTNFYHLNLNISIV